MRREAGVQWGGQRDPRGELRRESGRAKSARRVARQRLNDRLAHQALAQMLIHLGIDRQLALLFAELEQVAADPR